MNGLRNFCRPESLFFLALSAGFGAYAVYRLVNIPRINYFETVYTSVAIAVAVLAAIVIALPPRLQRNLALSVAAMAVVGIPGSLLLPHFGVSPEAVIRQSVALLQPPGDTTGPEIRIERAADNRSVDEVVASLRNAGIEAYRSPSLRSQIELADNGTLPLLPLSGIANVTTANCNEGDQQQFPVLHSDRYGFNNDDTVYAMGGDRVMLVGDSFIYGQCVHQEQSIAGHLRRKGYAGISVGVGGNGPLFNLAALREYGRVLKPKTVVWFYTVGNDLEDLRDHELRSRILMRYFDSDYTQGLARRQGEVDRIWKTIWNDPDRWRPLIDAHGTNAAAYAADGREEAADVLRRLREVAGTGMPDIASVKDSADVAKIIGLILRTARRDVEAWGGRLYFAPIWGAAYYRLGILPPHIDAVMAEARAAGLPFIDLDRAVRASGDHDLFFPVTKDMPHHNSRGYELFADGIIAALAPKAGIYIAEATFGGNCKGVALPPPIINIARDGNATRGVSGACAGRPECTFRTGNALVGGDPAGGCVKDFSATWLCLETKNSDKIYVDKNETGTSQVTLRCDDGKPTHAISVVPSGSAATAPPKPAASSAAIQAHTPKASRGEISGEPVNRTEFEYVSYVGLGNRVSADGAPSVAETASIMGREIVPAAPDSRYRVIVEVPGYANSSAELVVGIFYIGSSHAVAYQRLPIGDGKTRATARIAHEFDIGGIPRLGLDIRVGIGAGGTVFLNGTEQGRDESVARPQLIVEEYSAQ
ncbi:MAG: hypothetical protein WD767_08440 [Alphaproteobacteria bacterium]